MKSIRLSLLVCLLITTSALFGQKRFQPGYYIDNSGNRIEGLIKNDTWQDNPSRIDFKSQENGRVTNLELDKVKEFEITNELHYVRATVEIDRSSSKYQFISGDREPQFLFETLFLKVLFKGEASLYSFKEGDLQRYFYAVNNGAITQLVYKVFSRDGKIAANNTYKSQLLQDLNCGEPDLKTVRSLEYKKRDLVSYFENYAQCKGFKYDNYSSREKKSLALKIRALGGLSISSMAIKHERFGINNDLGNKIGFALGAELEFFLPSPRQEWSVIFQPYFSSFNATADLQEIVDVKYNSFDVGLGARKYFPVSEKSRIFIGGYLNVYIPTVESIPLSLYINGLTYTTDTYWVLSLGLEVNDKLSGEIKYGLSRDLLSSWEEWTADFQSTTLTMRYRIFD